MRRRCGLEKKERIKRGCWQGMDGCLGSHCGGDDSWASLKKEDDKKDKRMRRKGRRGEEESSASKE